jgi:AraC family transcriptional regulator of adaptative response / DNA-3-methyladenine glycosylase II
MIDILVCEKAMQSRDPKFDGLFFIGVLTTGVYCRPVCKARMPQRKNIEFYPSAAAAETAGFRPCLRCRPEAAPFCPAWNGTKTTVERAIRLIEKGELDRHGVPQLAERLGVGTRHLGRLFKEHLDASPLEVATTLRIQRAKRLLNETDFAIDEIASRSGFPSARRMHAAFVNLYGRSPSAFRRPKRRGSQSPTFAT